MINIMEIQDQEGGVYHPITDAEAVKLTNGDNLQQKTESLDTQIAGKVDKISGKGLSTNDYTTEEKTKLAGIAENANNYNHPATHPASMITFSDGKTLQEIFNEAVEVTDWNDAVNPGVYFSKSSAANKPPFLVSLDVYGIVLRHENSVKQILTTDWGNEWRSRYCTDCTQNNWTQWTTILHNASDLASGLMSIEDKNKLDGIDENANNYTHPTSSGNKHIPSGGESGQILLWNADGTASWGNMEGIEAQLITNWNDATETGFYYSANNAVNAPQLGTSDYFGIVIAHDNYVKQIVTTTVGLDCAVRFDHGAGFYGWQSPLPNATTEKSGLLSAADKTKLDGTAPLASPAFTGTPTAPTPAISTNSTRIATTAFVKSQGYVTSSHTHTASQITQDTTHRFVTDIEKSKWDNATTFVFHNPILSSLGSDIYMKITAASNPNNAKSVKILVTGTVTLGTPNEDDVYMDLGSSLDIPVHIDWSNAVFPQMNTKTENITLIRHTGVNTVYHEGLTIRAAGNESLQNGTTCIENAGEGDIVLRNCDLIGVDTIGAALGGVAVRHTGTGRTFIDNCQLYHIKYGSNICIENSNGEVFLSNCRLKRADNYGTMLNTQACRSLQIYNCSLEGNVSISGKNVFLSNCNVKGSFTVSAGACVAIENSLLYFQGNAASAQAALYVAGESKLLNCTLIGENEYSTASPVASGYGAYLNGSTAKLTASNCTFRGYRHSSNTMGLGLGIGGEITSISANTCMVLNGCRFDRVTISSRIQTGDISIGTSSICPKYNILGCSFYSATVSLGGSNITSTTTTGKYMPSYANFFSQTT